MGVDPRRIDNAYLEVERWTKSAVGRELQEAEAFEQEAAGIASQIAALQERVRELDGARGRALERAQRAEGQRSRMLYETLFDVLAEQARSVEVRAVEVREAEVEGDAQLLAKLVEDPQRAARLQDYLDFKKSVEPGLAAFPEDYRQSVLDKHAEVRRALVAYFDALPPWVPPVRTTRTLGVDVLVAVDEPDEDTAVVMAVLPVPAEVQLRWADRHDTLGTAIAARAVEGMYRAAIGMKQPTAQVMLGGHRSLLVAEIVLVGDPAELGPAVAGAMQAALDRGMELQAARVEPRVKVVDVDHVLPPELFPVEEAARA